jgi:hypothetical protein
LINALRKPKNRRSCKWHEKETKPTSP